MRRASPVLGDAIGVGAIVILLTVQCTACANALESETTLGPEQNPTDADVVMIALEDGAVGCSGVHVSRHLVLTAGHCDADALRVGTGTSPQHAVWSRVVRRYRHSRYDALLLELTEPGAPIALTMDAGALNDRDAVLVGYGHALGDQAVRLRAVAEHITQTDHDTLLLEARAALGPCQGDSGAPVLVSEASGGFSLAGMLTTGALHCDGRDYALRADALALWISELASNER